MKLEFDVDYCKEKKEFEVTMGDMQESGIGKSLAMAITAFLSVEKLRSAVNCRGVDAILDTPGTIKSSAKEAGVSRSNQMGQLVEGAFIRVRPKRVVVSLRAIKFFYMALDGASYRTIGEEYSISASRVDKLTRDVWDRAVKYLRTTGQVPDNICNLRGMLRLREEKEYVSKAMKIFEAHIKTKEELQAIYRNYVPDKPIERLDYLKLALTGKTIKELATNGIGTGTLCALIQTEWQKVVAHCQALNRISLYISRLVTLDELRNNLPNVAKAIQLYEEHLRSKQSPK